MRRILWVVMAIGVGAGCAQKHASTPPAGEIRHLALKEAPKPVAKGLAHDFPGSTVDQIDLTRIEGFDQYTIYLTTHAGEKRIVRYDEAGSTIQ